MARYVLGDELKPGERWKRRLLIARRAADMVADPRSRAM